MSTINKFFNFILQVVKSNDFTNPDVQKQWDICEKWQQAQILENTENILSRCLQAGVRHAIRNEVVAVADYRMVYPLLAKAKKISKKNKKFLVNGIFMKEEVAYVKFQDGEIPSLKHDDWQLKQYMVAKDDNEHDIHVREHFRAKVTKLSFTYYFSTKVLEANMEWETYKFTKMGKYEYWGDSN